MIAQLAINAEAATGETGSFLYIGRKNCRIPVSPVFRKVAALLEWAINHEWRDCNSLGDVWIGPSRTVSVDDTDPVSLEKFCMDNTAPGVSRPSAGEWFELLNLQPGERTFVGNCWVTRIS